MTVTLSTQAGTDCLLVGKVTPVSSHRATISVPLDERRAEAQPPKTRLWHIPVQVMPCLATALEDYTTDNRGDVGSWAREAAMQVLTTVLLLLTSCQPVEHHQSALSGGHTLFSPFFFTHPVCAVMIRGWIQRRRSCAHTGVFCFGGGFQHVLNPVPGSSEVFSNVC